MINGSREACFKDFMSKMTSRFAPWDESKIKTILRERFVSYDPESNDKYVAFLQKGWEKEALESRQRVAKEAEHIRRERAAKFAASPEEQARRKQLAEEQYGPEYCPVCGEKTINAEGWWSRPYKMPGWRCSEGGPTHFLKWARENRSKHVQQPVPDEE